jgi:hypothetical protein
MECGVSVRLHKAQFLILSVFALIVPPAAAEDAVVLVTGEDSAIDDISSLDIRKAYLGISVTIDGKVVRPLRRGDDERLDRVFLQSVIAMSRRSYERRLLSLVLKFGTPRPVEVADRKRLTELLAEHPNSITYMWRSDAESDPHVRMIKVLWQEH